ncbi:MAG: transposase [Halobacteriota archaeon]
MRADGCLPRRANALEVTTMWYIGIDVHKKMCNACIKDLEGNIQKELEFPNKSTGTDKLLEAIEGREAKAVIESTGNMWLRLYLGLEEAGVEVVLANPKKTKAIAEAKLENDKVDARTLADLLRAKLIAHCYVPPESVRELRSWERIFALELLKTHSEWTSGETIQACIEKIYMDEVVNVTYFKAR